MILRSLVASLGIIAITGAANAQISISAGDENIHVDAGGGVSIQNSGGTINASPLGNVSIDTHANGAPGRINHGVNAVGNAIGGVANADGVTVANGRVHIDGKEIPPGINRYKSKDGTIYRINRRGNGVSVINE
jgi:hypothetical protein